MPVEVNIEQFLGLSKTIPVIDVRSPSEFQKGHVPGAINIPLFSDEERAKVGTLYVQKGREDAFLLGFEIAGPKLKQFCIEALEIATDKKLLVHCWRGGMRSSSMAWLFDQTGIETFVLKGGYKSFRRHVLETFSNPPEFIVLGGMTGSGKTQILQEIKKGGEQVIDLEAMAHHKGSAFGGLGQAPQPTQEQFENNLFSETKSIDYSLSVWVEDESIAIGKIQLPKAWFEKMKQSRVICVEVNKETRLKRLVNEYSGFPHDLLAQSIKKIEKRLGYDCTKAALEALSRGDYYKVSDITLYYYDKAYRNQLDNRPQERISAYSPKSDIPAEIAQEIKIFTETLKSNQNKNGYPKTHTI
jgi:tRNA 2-selenouridine synthase